MWSKRFRRPSYEFARTVEQLHDGGFIVLGVAGSTGEWREDIWLIRLDPSGNLLWEKKIGKGREKAFDLLISDDDGYLIVGSTDTRARLVLNQ